MSFLSRLPETELQGRTITIDVKRREAQTHFHTLFTLYKRTLLKGPFIHTVRCKPQTQHASRLPVHRPFPSHRQPLCIDSSWFGFQ
ncbi:DUF4944 domain-containing protein [Bacillus nakamurai]|uniref:DUF4944 domain-containing protein n=1 Tax=Bacillus nakamurai TaxID=1793963 RepID=UPI0012E7BF2D